MAFLEALTGGLGLAKSLFGSKQTQNQSQRQYTEFRPEDIAAMDLGRSRIEAGRGGLLEQLAASKQALQSGITMPTGGFKFSQTPTALTMGLLAQNAQGTADRTAAIERLINRTIQGPAAGISRTQARIKSQLGSNPALFDAMRQQQATELAQEQQNLMNINAANQTLFQREQGLTSLAGTGLSSEQQLFDQLMRYAAARGVNVGSGQSSGRSGGLF